MKTPRKGESEAHNMDTLIDELSQSTPDAIKKMRQHTRLSVRVTVYVEAASVSERTGPRLHGVSGDISAGGMQILVPRPLLLGDVYQISFDRDVLDMQPVYALCLRGRMVRPDAYEAGLRFLESVTLPVSEDAPRAETLV